MRETINPSPSLTFTASLALAEGVISTQAFFAIVVLALVSDKAQAPVLYHRPNHSLSPSFGLRGNPPKPRQ